MTEIHRQPPGSEDPAELREEARAALQDALHEVNRAPAKVQSARLEVMQEHQVTIGGASYPVPRPFLAMATQNPIESEGTYPLPEAQVDRFLMKIVVDYPSVGEESAVVGRSLGASAEVRERVSLVDLERYAEAARS